MTWGTTYNGEKIYMVVDQYGGANGADAYMGWVNEQWVDLEYEITYPPDTVAVMTWSYWNIGGKVIYYQVIS